jgi:hypothetical protein
MAGTKTLKNDSITNLYYEVRTQINIESDIIRLLDIKESQNYFCDMLRHAGFTSRN